MPIFGGGSPELNIPVSMDASGAISESDKLARNIDDVDKATERASKGGNKLGGALNVLGGGALAATGLIVGLGAGLFKAAEAAAEEQVGIDRLNGVLENSIPNWDGNTKAVEEYIAQQEKLAFADDQLRDSLSFLVGQTGDLAEAQELQAVAMDLARANGIDLATATKAVGKVDQDSIGILKKLGIEVTEQMTKEEALAAIRTKSAGAAETYADSTAGAVDRIKGAFGNIVEDVGGAVLGLVAGPLQGLADWFQSPEVQAGIQVMATAIGDTLTGAFNALKTVFDTVGPPIMSFFQGLGPIIQGALDTIMPIIQPILDQMKAMFEERFMAVWGIIQQVWGIIQGFLQEKGGAIIADIMGWAQQIGPIIGDALQIAQDLVMSIFGFIQQFLADHGEEIKAILGMAWDTISMLIDAALQIIETIIIPAFQAIATFIQEHGAEIQGVIDAVWGIISTIVTTAMDIIQGIITTVMALIEGDWEGAWEAIKGIGESLWNGIVELLKQGWALIEGLFNLGVEALRGIWEPAWNWISQTATDAWTAITKTVEDAWNGVSKFITDIGDGIKKTWEDLWDAVGKFLNDTWTGITNKFNEIWTFITELPGKALTEAQKFGQAIVDGVMNGLAGMWDAIWGFISGILAGVWDGIVNFFGGGGGEQPPAKGATGKGATMVGMGGMGGVIPNGALAPPGVLAHGGVVVQILVDGRAWSLQELSERLGLQIRLQTAGGV